MASKKFETLERHVEAEYRKRGYSLARARQIGRAVAGQVAHRKHNPKGKGTRHCSICNAVGHDRRAHEGGPRHYKKALARHTPVTRRNPRKPPPSHDLFGEREHKLSLFGGKTYAELPKAKRQAGTPKRKPREGQGSFDFGGTRSLFG